MSPSSRSPLAHDHIASGSSSSSLLTWSKIPRQLSQDAMLLLLEKTRGGERHISRTIISLTLNVNDVVAEYCLRHLEEKLRDEADYESRVLTQVAHLEQSTATDLQGFLRYTFGVQGKVSRAISDHLRAVTA